MLSSAAPQSSIELLEDGDVAFTRMLDAIRDAERSIRLEVYMMAATGIGAAFISALRHAARRGVRVDVVIDAWGTGLQADHIAALLRAGGCSVDVFNPILFGVLAAGMRRRNHRKLLLVDDRVAFVGGINLVDEFVGRNAWADVAVEIYGAAVRDLGARLRREPHAARDPAVQVLLSDVGGGRRLRRRYLKAFGAARSRILLAHSYFLPDHGLLRSLTAAARRGVDVRLLVPGRSDVPLARATTGLLYARLLAAGVKVYEWTGSILHAKLGVFDGERLLLGSFNLDTWSLADLETLVEAREPAVAASAERWIMRRVDGARAVTDHVVRTRAGRAIERIEGNVGLWLARAVGRLLATR